MDVSDDADRLQTLLYSSYSADVVRQLERPLLDDGVPLMRMAASAVARVTLSLLDDEDLDVEDARVTVLAGAGDNGGDGLYAGAELAREGAQVTAVAVGRSLHEDAFREFVRAGGRVLVLDPAADIPGCTSGFSAGEAGERLQAAVECARGAHVVLDAMTGIGVVGALRGVAGTLASSLGMDGVLPDKPALPNNDPSADLPLVVAVDAPSGVGVDDGSWSPMSSAILPFILSFILSAILIVSCLIISRLCVIVAFGSAGTGVTDNSNKSISSMLLFSSISPTPNPIETDRTPA